MYFWLFKNFKNLKYIRIEFITLSIFFILLIDLIVRQCCSIWRNFITMIVLMWFISIYALSSKAIFTLSCILTSCIFSQSFAVSLLMTDCDIQSANDGLVIPRLHDTAGCQTGCQTGLTTGWMFVYTIQPVVKPVW